MRLRQTFWEHFKTLAQPQSVKLVLNYSMVVFTLHV